MEITKGARIYHIISAALIALSLALSFFRFSGVLYRTAQGLEDFCTSIGYAFSTLYGTGDVVSTFPTIPDGATQILPFDPIILQAQVNYYFKTLFSWANCKEYLFWLSDKLYYFSLALSFVLLGFCCVLLILYGILKCISRTTANICSWKKYSKRSMRINTKLTFAY